MDRGKGAPTRSRAPRPPRSCARRSSDGPARQASSPSRWYRQPLRVPCASLPRRSTPARPRGNPRSNATRSRLLLVAAQHPDRVLGEAGVDEALHVGPLPLVALADVELLVPLDAGDVDVAVHLAVRLGHAVIEGAVL